MVPINGIEEVTAELSFEGILFLYLEIFFKGLLAWF